MRYFVNLPDGERVVALSERSDGSFSVTVTTADAAHAQELQAEILARRGDGILTLRIDGRVYDVVLGSNGGPGEAMVNGRAMTARVESDLRHAAAHPQSARGTDVVVSPMPGKILEVCVAVGERVERGAPLIVVEAMKMQNQLCADRTGVIGEVFVNAGDAVETGAPLVRIA